MLSCPVSTHPPMYVLLGKAPRCHDTLMYSHMYRASTATARLKT